MTIKEIEFEVLIDNVQDAIIDSDDFYNKEKSEIIEYNKEIDKPEFDYLKIIR